MTLDRFLCQNVHLHRADITFDRLLCQTVHLHRADITFDRLLCQTVRLTHLLSEEVLKSGDNEAKEEGAIWHHNYHESFSLVPGARIFSLLSLV